ncbi:MAG: protein kinase, partial [Deltaproteobacteria bacterium]|nr:protein kinase [Deltaproteobacteria bacterium]
MASRESARKFQFLREIASGGFGSVFLAKVMHADGFSRLVAIKLLHRRWSENKEIAQRMRDEARLLGWLRHRNIVDVIDLTSIDGRAAVIMEYLEAVDLKSVVQDLSDRGDRIPPYAALEIVSFVASALDAAYNRPPYEGEKPLRVIHRDIKPSNIMVDESGTVKVLDFGVARGEFENRESQTQDLNFGSVEYMPPERLFFEPETDRADVYSLGATLFEFLAGERLGKAKGRAEKHAAFLEDRLSYLAARCPLPNPQSGDLAKFIRDMCAYNADNRPSAEALVSRGRHLARQMPGPALAEFAEQAVRPLVAAQSRAPREPNPLTEKVLAEDGTLFGSGEMVDRGGTPPATADAPRADGPVADVPRDDARWEALRKAALAEMAVAEAEPAVVSTPGPSLSTAQAPESARVDGYDDEPTRIGAAPPGVAAVSKLPAADPEPVRSPAASPRAGKRERPPAGSVTPMIVAAPTPVDDLASEEMPVLAPPPGTAGISAPTPRALKQDAPPEPSTPEPAAPEPSAPEPLPLIAAPGGYSGLDPISAEVVGPA